MVNTHCLPSGSRGTNELPVPSICTANCTTYTPGGAKRGIVVALHGLGTATIPVPVTDITSGFITGYAHTFSTDMAADGWIVVWPLYISDTYTASSGLPNAAEGIFNDVEAASGSDGARLKTNILHWWDHVLGYLRRTYNSAMPVCLFGLSYGGHLVYQIASQRDSEIAAYAAFAGPPILSNVPIGSWTSMNSSGCDIATTALNGSTKPGLIGWNTNDPLCPAADIDALFDEADASPAPVTSRTGANGHSFVEADSDFYVAWWGTDVDPSCPANF